MLDEENKTNETGEVVDNTDYIAAINKLKENSVDRSKYESLKAENKKLLDAIVNGQSVEVPQEKQKKTIEELRETLFSGKEVTNLEYVTNALELRKQLIENGKPDPFVPVSKQDTTPEYVKIATAENVANGLQELVDYADGDPEVFQREFVKRLKS